MPATITIPPSPGNYSGNLVTAPYDWREPPTQDWQRISGSISWNPAVGDARNGACVVNFQTSISNFDKIRGMYVDNTQNSADLTLFFPDSQFEFTVNSGEKDFFQVVTNSRQVVFISPTALTTDKTFFQLFNFAPPPLASNKSVLTSAANGTNLSLIGNNTLAVIAAGTNGTIRGFTVNVARVILGAGAGNVALQLTDGGSNVIWTGSVGGDPAKTPTQLLGAELANMNTINVRFTNGLSLVGTAGGANFADGVASATVYFGTP